MNFSAISNNTPLGKLLRAPLRLVPSETCLPILQGKLRGKKWIAGSSNHGCWLGSYEYRKRLLFEKLVAAGSVVFDVGANVGFYTLLAAVLAGRSGKVVAFEPVASNLNYLRRHLALNNISNVTVIEAAVSDRPGTAPFVLGPNASMGHFSSDGAIRVKTVCLDELVSTGGLPVPGYLKIDVEGAEMLVLLGARSLLAEFHPLLFLSTDIGDLHRQCCRFLASLGYDLHPIDAHHLDQAYEILAFQAGTDGVNTVPAKAESLSP